MVNFKYSRTYKHQTIASMHYPRHSHVRPRLLQNQPDETYTSPFKHQPNTSYRPQPRLLPHLRPDCTALLMPHPNLTVVHIPLSFFLHIHTSTFFSFPPPPPPRFSLFLPHSSPSRSPPIPLPFLTLYLFSPVFSSSLLPHSSPPSHLLT